MKESRKSKINLMMLWKTITASYTGTEQRLQTRQWWPRSIYWTES